MDHPLAGPGPVRAFRDRYVASFGGVSYDLAPRALGVHPGCLRGAPELPGRLVLVTRDDARQLLPRRVPFLVVPLSDLMRNARDLASRGGIVFSAFAFDDPAVAHVLDGLDLGEPVFLNAAVERMPDTPIRRPFGGEATA